MGLFKPGYKRVFSWKGLKLHFHFNRHINSQDFEKIKTAFRKYGPFDVFAAEQPALSKGDFKYLIGLANFCLNLARDDEDERREFIKNGTSLTHPEFSRELMGFLVDNPPLLYAPIEYHSFKLWSDARIMLMEQARTGVPSANVFNIDYEFAREREIIFNIIEFLSRLSPIAKEVAKQLEKNSKIKKYTDFLLPKESIDVFAIFGPVHIMMAKFAEEKYENNSGIKISYSFENKKIEEIFNNYSSISFKEYKREQRNIYNEIIEAQTGIKGVF